MINVMAKQYVTELNFWFIGLNNINDSIRVSWEHYMMYKTKHMNVRSMKYEVVSALLNHLNFKILHGSENNIAAVILFFDSNSYELIDKMIDLGFESKTIAKIVNDSRSEVLKATYALINP